jgi:N-acylneuraminate cytidylyltransferase
MRILGLIPARGGSKALPNKNTIPLAGKSLVQRTYECALASDVLDRIILSTDSEAIAEHAREFGLEAPFLRPSVFATDTSPMIDVATHTLNFLAEEGDRYDAVVLLQPTSPLRTPDHIRKAVTLLGDHDAVCSVVSVPAMSNPYRMVKITDKGLLDFVCPEGRTIKRRQDAPRAYWREGTIFLTRVEVILQQGSFYGESCVVYELSPEESLNIDTAEQWEAAERRLAEETNENSGC